MAYWLTQFTDGDESFVAYGPDPDDMPVYEVLDEGHVWTPKRFPSCLKFMQYADVGEVMESSPSNVVRVYGPLRTR